MKPGATTAPGDLALLVARPHIASVVPANGGPGTQVVVSGEHFGATRGETLAVLFGGAVATEIERLDDRTIRAWVPGSGGSSGLVVRVGVVESAPAAFQVIRALGISPVPLYVHLLGPTVFAVTATDTEGAVVAGPAVEWSALGPVKVERGEAVALGEGDATVSVRSGTVGQAIAFRVTGSPIVSTLAGGPETRFLDGPLSAARFQLPRYLALAPDGAAILTDGHCIRRIVPGRTVATVAGRGAAGATSASFAEPGAVGQPLPPSPSPGAIAVEVEVDPGSQPFGTIPGTATGCLRWPWASR